MISIDRRTSKSQLYSMWPANRLTLCSRKTSWNSRCLSISVKTSCYYVRKTRIWTQSKWESKFLSICINQLRARIWHRISRECCMWQFRGILESGSSRGHSTNKLLKCLRLWIKSSELIIRKCYWRILEWVLIRKFLKWTNKKYTTYN